MRSSLVSAMIHLGLVGLVVLFTPHIVHSHQRPREASHIVYIPPASVVHPGIFFDGLGRCQCIATLPPEIVPLTIPGVDLSLPPVSTDIGTRGMDKWDGASHERGSGGEQTPTGVLSADVVDVQVMPYPDAPTPRYPEVLREAGIEGEVVLEFVVDTTGHVDRESVRVISTPSDAFVLSVRDALAATRYHPALVAGQRVRQLVRQGFVFSLTQH